MINALYLLILIGMLGAADTLYFHEWRTRLPVLGKRASAELRLHAARDFIYAILFATLPRIAWKGLWAGVLVLLLLGEAVLTMWDFMVEDWVRKPLGGVYPAERVMHAVMGILYGAMLVYLIPSLQLWWGTSTRFTALEVPVQSWLRWTMLIMSIGVFASGVRDLCASFDVRGSAWPWKHE